MDLTGANIYGGDDLLARLGLMNVLGTPGQINEQQLNYMPWANLPGINDYRMQVPVGGNPLDGTMSQGVFSLDPSYGAAGGGTVNPTVLAQYLKDSGYQIGQKFDENQDWRWIQDAQGNYLPGFEPTNYYTNDRTAALIGMGLLGGMLGTAVAGGVGAAGATGAAEGAAAAGTTGGTAGGLIDSAFAAEMASAGSLAPEGVGALYGGTGELALGGGTLGGAGAAGSFLNAGETYGDLIDTAASQYQKDQEVQSGLTGGQPQSTNPLGNAYQWLKDNPELAKMLFGGAGSLLTQVGGDSGGAQPYTGPMPTISRGGWSPTAQARTGLMMQPLPGLMGTANENAGLLRYLKGKP